MDDKDTRLVTFSRRRAALAAACVMLTVAGCDDPAPSRPESHATVSAAAPTATAPPRPASVAELDPCALITDTQARGYGYTSREAASFGPPMCIYMSDASPQGAGPGQALSISFGDGVASLRPNPADTVSSTMIGQHTAMQIQAADAPRCTIVVSVTATESVHVSATRDSLAEACEVATDATRLIEPRLPLH